MPGPASTGIVAVAIAMAITVATAITVKAMAAAIGVVIPTATKEITAKVADAAKETVKVGAGVTIAAMFSVGTPGKIRARQLRKAIAMTMRVGAAAEAAATLGSPAIMARRWLRL